MKNENDARSRAPNSASWSASQRLIVCGAIVLSVGLTLVATFRLERIAAMHFIQYVIPMVLFAAAMFASRLGQTPFRWSSACVDLMAIGIAGSRMIDTSTSFSGHMVLLVYGVLIANNRALRIAGGVLLIHVSILKLWVWADFKTWTYGTLIGICLYGLARFLKLKRTTHRFL